MTKTAKNKVASKWQDEPRSYEVSRAYAAHLLRSYRRPSSMVQCRRVARGIYETQVKYPNSPTLIINTRDNGKSRDA